jgi:hypothetical protein
MTKSNRILLTGTVVLVAFGLMFTAACKGKSLSEKIAEKAIERATGGKAQVDANSGSLKIKTKEGEVEYGAASKWPSDIPEDVPKFEAGKFQSSTRMSVDNGTSWIMGIGDVEGDAVTAYVQALKDAGWNEGFSSTSDKTYHFQSQKDEYGIVLIYDKEGKQLAYTFSHTLNTKK